MGVGVGVGRVWWLRVRDGGEGAMERAVVAKVDVVLGFVYPCGDLGQEGAMLTSYYYSFLLSSDISLTDLCPLYYPLCRTLALPLFSLNTDHEQQPGSNTTSRTTSRRGSTAVPRSYSAPSGARVRIFGVWLVW